MGEDSVEKKRTCEECCAGVCWVLPTKVTRIRIPIWVTPAGPGNSHMNIGFPELLTLVGLAYKCTYKDLYKVLLMADVRSSFVQKQYKVSIKPDSAWRLVQNLKLIDQGLSGLSREDREAFQVVLEARYLRGLLESGGMSLPYWDLAMIRADQASLCARCPQIKRALKEAVSELQQLIDLGKVSRNRTG